MSIDEFIQDPITGGFFPKEGFPGMGRQANDLDVYQEKAHGTAQYPGQGETLGYFYLVAKLAGEAGEVAEKFGKQIRDKGGDFASEDFRKAQLMELGDVLWYIQELAGVLGYTLSEVADANIEKLYSRKARGVLGGSGDDR